MNTALDIIKKLGEDVSAEYEINWEDWGPELTSKLEKELNEILPTYEKYFLAHPEDDNTLQLQHVVDDLIHGYALRHLINRKRYIEEVLSTI